MQQQQQQTINKLQSLTLTKNLLLATIGSIAYVRMLFPEDNFLTKGLDGIAVKTLKQNVSLEANTLLEWIERGVFDAIQKQYLHQLVFGIYLNPENPLDVIEQYQFEFTYPDKDSYGFSITKETKPLVKDITNSTRQMIRKLLVLTQSLEPLPENAYITMRLFYHDHTPIDYEPPYFKAGSETLPLGIVPVQLGSIETAHHEIRLQVATKCKAGQEEVDAEMIPASQDMDLSQREYPQMEKSASVMTQIVESPQKPAIQHDKVSELFDLPIPSSQPMQISQPQLEHDSIVEPEPFLPNQVIATCACKSELSKYLIQCNACQLYSHFPCYGYTNASDPRLQSFLCYDCDPKPLIHVADFTLLAQRRLVMFSIQQVNESPTVRRAIKLTEMKQNPCASALKFLRNTGIITQNGRDSVLGDCTAFFCVDLNYGDDHDTRHSRDSGVGIKRGNEEVEPAKVFVKPAVKKRKVSVVQQDLAVL